MSIFSAAPVVLSAPRATRQNLNHAALVAAGTITMLLSSARVAAAQTLTPHDKTWELRVSSGAFVPAGNQRNFLKDAQISAAQISWLLRPSLAITGTLGLARSRDVATLNSPKLDVFTSDIGVEARHAQLFAGRRVSFSPFVGIGGGARSYNYRNLDIDATNNLAAYASVGGEAGVGRVAVRLEARDYATGFRPLINGGKSDTRNDVVIMAAVRFNRRASQH